MESQNGSNSLLFSMPLEMALHLRMSLLGQLKNIPFSELEIEQIRANSGNKEAANSAPQPGGSANKPQAGSEASLKPCAECRHGRLLDSKNWAPCSICTYRYESKFEPRTVSAVR